MTECILGVLCGFFLELRPKRVLSLRECADITPETFVLGATSPHVLKHTQRRGHAEQQGHRETPVAKKTHKEATGFLLSGHRGSPEAKTGGLLSGKLEEKGKKVYNKEPEFIFQISRVSTKVQRLKGLAQACFPQCLKRP